MVDCDDYLCIHYAHRKTFQPYPHHLIVTNLSLASPSLQLVHLLGECLRAAQVGIVGARELTESERDSFDGWGNEAIEVRWHTLGGDLVEQAGNDLGVGIDGELAVLDGAEVDGVEGAVRGVTTLREVLATCHGRVV